MPRLAAVRIRRGLAPQIDKERALRLARRPIDRARPARPSSPSLQATASTACHLAAAIGVSHASIEPGWAKACAVSAFIANLQQVQFFLPVLKLMRTAARSRGPRRGDFQPCPVRSGSPPVRRRAATTFRFPIAFDASRGRFIAFVSQSKRLQKFRNHFSSHFNVSLTNTERQDAADTERQDAVDTGLSKPDFDFTIGHNRYTWRRQASINRSRRRSIAAAGIDS